MKFSHTPTRIYSIAENGALQAEITFPMVSKGVYCTNHTFVDDSLRGQGIASALVQAAVEQIHEMGGQVTATCSYARDWLQRHPEA